MLSGYSHLSESERYHLYISLKQGKSVRSIARDMGRHHATLNREIARNTGERGYRYKQAQRFAETRHKTKPKARKWNTELKAYVTDKIKYVAVMYFAGSFCSLSLTCLIFKVSDLIN